MAADWPKSPESLVARFRELVPSDDRIQRKQMFGYPCAVVSGYMFMSLHGEHLVLRLPEPRIDELVSQAGFARFEPMAGRPMKGYVSITPDEIEEPSALDDLVQAAFAHGSSLPAKVLKPRKPSPAR